MAITLAKNYIDLLDEVYKNASCTSDLTANPTLVRAGSNAKSVLYPMISLKGLGDYTRNSGYTDGAVDVSWTELTFSYDRGTKISVDTMDNQESFNIAFGRAGAELMRTKVVPEADAYTFARLAGTSGISKVSAGITYADGAAFLTALINAQSVMDEDEVPYENRILYTTPTLLNLVMALDTTKSREVLSSFSKTVKVPQSRFYTAIDLLDGKSENEQDGGYKKATAGKDINFMIVHKDAVIKIDKHIVSNVIDPANNPNADSYILKYRKYGEVDVVQNKKAGIYLSHKA